MHGLPVSGSPNARRPARAEGWTPARRLATWLRLHLLSARLRVRRTGALRAAAGVAYVLLILFLLALSVGYDASVDGWRLGTVRVETIVLALLLFLPLLLPRVSSLTFPFLTGQASIQFRELHERIDVQERKVAVLSNETDLLINSLAANVLAPHPDEIRDVLVIGCQRGTEQKILGALLNRVLREGLNLEPDAVITRYDNGGGAFNFISAHRHKIDLCPAYTWQGYEMSLGPSLQDSAPMLNTLSVVEAIDDLNRRYASSAIRWLSYLGFSSNWELVMVAEKAAALGIEVADDLPARSSRLVLGCPREFFARDAAYGTLQQRGARFAEVKFLEGVALYDALLDGTIDVAVGFSTDARLDSFAFAVLDSSGWFGEYHAVAIAHRDTTGRCREIIAELGTAIRAGGETEQTPWSPDAPDDDPGRRQLRRLVREVEGLGESTEVVELVAERFLLQSGLLANLSPGRRSR